MEPRARAGRLAGAALALAVVLTLAAAVVDVLAGEDARDAVRLGVGWTSGIPGVALAAAGAVVLTRLPRHPLGWVLSVSGVHWAVDGLALSWLALSATADPPLAGASVSYWLYQRLGSWLLLGLPLLLLLYPDGRLPEGRWWRRASVVSLVTTCLLPLTLLVVPARIAEERAADGPLPEPLARLDLDLTTVPLPDGVYELLLSVAFPAVAVSLVVPFAVVVRRYRAARGTDAARRMRWLLWAGLVDALFMLSAFLLPEPLTSWGLVVALVVTAAAVAVGIARPDVTDVDRLLGGTVLYAALGVTVLAVDAVVLWGAGAVLGDRLDGSSAAVLAVGAVALAYAPLRERLHRAVRRWVVGERDDPYGVVSLLAERLERSDRAEDQLLTVARAVADAFRVRWVGVEVDQADGQRLLVATGPRPDGVSALPVSYRGEEVGRLLLPRGGPRHRLSARDERLLADVVRQAAAAARSHALAAALQHGREQLVAAREEERRRLRRDLHDGLGPVLGSVVLRIDTARRLATRSPEDADAVLVAARDDVAAALADVRRLVHDLRPPALDDVGLLGAVRQQAARVARPGLAVDVRGHGLDGLPAAVEVAAYRITSEALANVSRHAGASRADVSLVADGGELVVEVVDDGVGIPAQAAAGVGLVSLRERAAELGGRCEVVRPPHGGTAVRARIPLAVEVLGA